MLIPLGLEQPGGNVVFKVKRLLTAQAQKVRGSTDALFSNNTPSSIAIALKNIETIDKQ